MKNIYTIILTIKRTYKSKQIYSFKAKTTVFFKNLILTRKKKLI